MNAETYEHYIETVKVSARRKRSGKSSIEASDGTRIEADKAGNVWIDGEKASA